MNAHHLHLFAPPKGAWPYDGMPWHAWWDADGDGYGYGYGFGELPAGDDVNGSTNDDDDDVSVDDDDVTHRRSISNNYYI